MRKTGIFLSRLIYRATRKRQLIIVGVSVLIVAAVVAGLFAFLPRHNGNSSSTDNPVISKYKQQLPDLKKKAEENPNDTTALKNYAIALYASGDAEAAKVQYEKLVAADGKDADTFNNLGNAYRDTGKVDDAIRAYQKALELNPQSVNTYANLANVQLYTKNNPSDAIATYQKGLSALPNNSQLEFLLGVAYEKANKKADAIQTYRHILSYDAGNKAVQQELARLQESK